MCNMINKKKQPTNQPTNQTNKQKNTPPAIFAQVFHWEHSNVIEIC